MENSLTSLLPSKDDGRILVITKDRNGNLDWIDAAEFAQSAGITPEQYPTWLNSMR